MTEEFFKYLEEYRRLTSLTNKLRAETSEIERKCRDMHEEALQLDYELSNMRTLITFMIDNDIDPVEAKLKTSSDDRFLSIWNNKNHIDSMNTVVQSINTPSGSVMTAAGNGGNTTWAVLPAFNYSKKEETLDIVESTDTYKDKFVKFFRLAAERLS